MASWVLVCPNCRIEFEHSRVLADRLSDWQLPNKPELPNGRAEFECPNCAHVAKYERYDFRYKA